MGFRGFVVAAKINATTRPRHTTENSPTYYRTTQQGRIRPYDYQTARGIWVMKTTRLPTVLVAEDRAPPGLDRLWVGGVGRDAKGRSARREGVGPLP